MMWYHLGHIILMINWLKLRQKLDSYYRLLLVKGTLWLCSYRHHHIQLVSLMCEDILSLLHLRHTCFFVLEVGVVFVAILLLPFATVHLRANTAIRASRRMVSANWSFLLGYGPTVWYMVGVVLLVGGLDRNYHMSIAKSYSFSHSSPFKSIITHFK